MIIKEYYINLSPVRAQLDTGLASDELETIVGRFRPHSQRRGQLRGKVSIQANGEVLIRHHFNNKILWSSYNKLEKQYD